MDLMDEWMERIAMSGVMRKKNNERKLNVGGWTFIS